MKGKTASESVCQEETLSEPAPDELGHIFAGVHAGIADSPPG